MPRPIILVMRLKALSLILKDPSIRVKVVEIMVIIRLLAIHMSPASENTSPGLKAMTAIRLKRNQTIILKVTHPSPNWIFLLREESEEQEIRALKVLSWKVVRIGTIPTGRIMRTM